VLVYEAGGSCTAHRAMKEIFMAMSTTDAGIKNCCAGEDHKQFTLNRCRSRTPKVMKVVRFEVSTAVTMKNGVFWDVTPCDSCKNRHVSEESSASFIRVTSIGELGTTLAATSNRHTLGISLQRASVASCS
jgi:hypothetical protein